MLGYEPEGGEFESLRAHDIIIPAVERVEQNAGCPPAAPGHAI
jgi:hypothetical protein